MTPSLSHEHGIVFRQLRASRTFARSSSEAAHFVSLVARRVSSPLLGEIINTLLTQTQTHTLSLSLSQAQDRRETPPRRWACLLAADSARSCSSVFTTTQTQGKHGRSCCARYGNTSRVTRRWAPVSISLLFSHTSRPDSRLGAGNDSDGREMVLTFLLEENTVPAIRSVPVPV